MKKIIIASLMLAGALCSCTKDPVPGPSQPQALRSTLVLQDSEDDDRKIIIKSSSETTPPPDSTAQVQNGEDDDRKIIIK